MDRAALPPWSERAPSRRRAGDEYVLPSRAEALAGLRAALDAQDGPGLLTGESGVGKTWLCRALRGASGGPWRWVSVDLSPAIGASGLYRLILHAMGLGTAGGPAVSRAALGDALTDASADGERWALVVEEGHNASPDVLEELRVLANRLGEPGAFAGLLVTGQNALGRRLATRPLSPFLSRLAARVHLRPLAVDEVRGWLDRLQPGRPWPADEVERLHRDTAGNPRTIRLLAGLMGAPTAPAPARPVRAASPPTVRESPALPELPARAPDWDAPPVGPVKPPLQEADGMIEVGWDAAAEAGDGSEPPPRSADVAPAAESSDAEPGDGEPEVIDDHYAALQAWTEWTRNQGRSPHAVTSPGAPEDTPDGEADAPGEPAGGPAGAGELGIPNVWADGQHAFAPYGQLFSRLKPSRDAH